MSAMAFSHAVRSRACSINCGELGKQANCQVAVMLSIANHHAGLPIAYRLYLPRKWAKDAARRKKEHVPKAIKFKTKPRGASAVRYNQYSATAV